MARYWSGSAALAILGACAACSQPSGLPEGLPAEDLRVAVASGVVPLAAESIPAAVLDRLAQSRVVVVGETHRIREQGDLMGALVRGLYSRGFRQLLLEWPQMTDWLLADYVESTGLEPSYQPPLANVGGSVLAAIREFNRTLPPADRVQVHAIDVNLDEYGGAPLFVSILAAVARHLPTPAPVTAFLRLAYDTPARQTSALEQLRSELARNRTTLADTWGPRWYDIVWDMVDAELASVGIRADRQRDYDRTTREREQVMKRLADSLLDGYGDRTLVTTGNTHAQKSRLMGTEGVEWLGDYLVHRSPVAGGSVFVVGVTPARVVSGSGGSTVEYDVTDASPANEIWRVMHEVLPGRIGLLPLDDPVFDVGSVLMAFDGTIYAGAPKAHYDALILLPLGHRVPT